MHWISQLIFALISIGAIILFAKKVKEIRRNIFLGRKQDLPVDKKQAWNNVIVLALGQKKMFHNVPVAIMHLIIYAGFIIINIEVLEIVLDGLLGTHRLFQQPLGGFYNFLINCFEILAFLVLAVCVVFLIRRNVLNIQRFRKPELNGWPRSDANLILIVEIILMSLFLLMNAAEHQMHVQSSTLSNGGFVISRSIHHIFSGLSHDTLHIIERVCWWLHIIGIYAFLNYLPYSKHLHIVLAFPNAYYSDAEVTGAMENMPEIQNEVLYAMQPELAPTTASAEATKKFGAKDVMDLSWKNLMDAYSCTECGRCTAACPANITGKLLSPRKIMMDTRDRLEEVGKNINTNKNFTEDGKSLLHNYISVEELRACTTCNACVQECPVSISPLSIITQLRRYLIMEESNAPQEWNAMFSNVENNFAPWKFAPDDRANWAAEL
jgi:heterodisulfide reductase subunit C